MGLRFQLGGEELREGTPQYVRWCDVTTSCQFNWLFKTLRELKKHTRQNGLRKNPALNVNGTIQHVGEPDCSVREGTEMERV